MHYIRYIGESEQTAVPNLLRDTYEEMWRLNFFGHSLFQRPRGAAL